jgi:hypothetical protein
MKQLDDFQEIWLVQFDFHRPPGERPAPVRLVAKELRGGRLVRVEQEDLLRSRPPYPLGLEALFVAYDAAGPLGCHLALGWPVPARVLDLHAEFRCRTSGLLPPGDYGLADALAHLSSGPDAYSGVEPLSELLALLLPDMSMPHALLRGRYMAAVARMEWNGIPIDTDSLTQLRDGWGGIQEEFIRRLDARYGVYEKGCLKEHRVAAWVRQEGIPWPRHGGRLDLRLDAFREMAKVYPQVHDLKELRATLSMLRSFNLTVGGDGRNRCPLRPFASKTGRNQPRSSEFIFGPAKWLRGLIRPEPGRALAYMDYEQQEFGVAAALSGDGAMMEAYRTGDPYLAFGKQAGVIPPDATKDSHRMDRDRFKVCALATQYGMGARGLARRLGIPLQRATELLRLHKEVYSTYWRWTRAVGQHARRQGQLQAAFGWTVHAGREANLRSLRNFPLQANGAEMLRLACIDLTERGIAVCAPVHDALLIEAAADEIEQAVALCQQAMGRASEAVLSGFTLRTEARVLRHPERHLDGKGRQMWDAVFGHLGRSAA